MIDPAVRLASELLGARLHKIEKKKKRPYHLKKKENGLRKHQWKPGQSGNPKGRPPTKLSITAIINDILARQPEDAENIAVALIKMAKRGNLMAIESVINRVDGKVSETHRIEGELPINIRFVPAEVILGKRADVEITACEIKKLPPGDEKQGV